MDDHKRVEEGGGGLNICIAVVRGGGGQKALRMRVRRNESILYFTYTRRRHDREVRRALDTGERVAGSFMHSCGGGGHTQGKSWVGVGQKPVRRTVRRSDYISYFTYTRRRHDRVVRTALVTGERDAVTV